MGMFCKLRNCFYFLWTDLIKEKESAQLHMCVTNQQKMHM